MDLLQRKILLDSARDAVSNLLLGRAAPRRDPVDDEELTARRGVFVSLHVADRLRGCIGMVEPGMPLIDAVRNCAVSAASRDPRFSPLSIEELPQATIEISILSPPRLAEDPSDLEIGKHGVIASRGGLRGLLLPQVAVEHEMSREEFLDAACVKAGLAESAWREEGTRLELFTAEVFGDEPAP